MNALIGFVITVILLLLFCSAMYSIGYKSGSIAITKGEYVCKYNEFANDWDCKDKEDKQ